MPYTQHPTITDAVINLSRHELGHYWMASLCGFFADGIQLHADHGACQIQYSMAPANFSPSLTHEVALSVRRPSFAKWLQTTSPLPSAGNEAW